MSRPWLLMSLAAGACGLLPAVASAQEFRIYTVVYNDVVREPDQKPVIVGRSLSMFHGGKAYDYIDAVNEVTIFEPAAHRFTVINSSRMMATTLDFAELERLIGEAEVQGEKFIKAAREEQDAEVLKRVPMIEFQLRPIFKTTYHARQQRLILSHSLFTYDVQCASLKSPESVTTYLRYADRTAQLNYILHPQAMHPGPRLALNAALRERNVLPVKVTLKAALGRDGVQLRAEHQIREELDRTDRQLIHQWESLLTHKDMQSLSFQEFQQELLADRSRKRN